VKTKSEHAPAQGVTLFGPDFPFAFDDWLRHPAGLGIVPAVAHGREVAVVGGGLAGMVAAHELMKLGLRPVVYESARLGGRLYSHAFEGADGVVAELGGMRFPRSSACFYHYVELLGLSPRAFPNPLSPGASSTVVDLEGQTYYAETLADLPSEFREVAKAWDDALEQAASLSKMKAAIRVRDVAAIKRIWNALVPLWDDRTFYDFIASSKAFARLSFRHREIFGQVGFGTGGWDSDFSNSMLEILRVVMTECEDDQYFLLEGAEQLVRRLWAYAPERIAHWPAGTSLHGLHSGTPRPGVRAIQRDDRTGDLVVVDQSGDARSYGAVLTTCQSWLLTTQIDVDEALFSQKLWMALDRTRYMQSSKTFVLVDRPFWKEKNKRSGRDVMSMTLTDRNTRGTYLFDYGDDRPGVICLSYAWMSDALKMLPLSAERRVELGLAALAKIYPDLDLKRHIIGDPIAVSWEADPNFLGAFKGALPGHYRYNHRMYGHFMQDDLPPTQRGLFIAGDDVSWTPGWAEGAVQTALNAVWGIARHFGGATQSDNPGPGDRYAALGPLTLPD
jgi:tryptophan 2-monooxygenase